MTQTWEPTLKYTTEVTCKITLVRAWKPNNMQTGIHLSFDVFPNLGFTRTSVDQSVWERKVQEYVFSLGARLTGLKAKDFFEVGWGVGPCITIGTAKAPKKQVQV
ncbi:MAG: hypothetical protein UU77_C0029G0008 [candidate division WWE3 bacterium GW2011_GWC1_41_7]|uniref:Uncharacterized protein n=4 Tax=Katanobacteria TaxID=422282 RepID=A0A0G0ZIU4_UNCKA|nr:MAG: hypothetical protein UU72_C0008G0036 [candidate division WWE3 bacterium GW2011_GWB1_41_6]KKS20327.1 MAG: hypothetical protein UU77_C0029G0008 [candidate division WWE3 bacterium GW2011_GWC1_41_7]KKS21976.1 MAG: hypothetical protein UU80_C0016G0008 [candidate division WWE3 bacterium GW2011_GWA1_41_8]OGC56790.1 MAG: hypothetical protein A2976_01490 [candidate division WWE3 bacterium RIFCSPLOWO2_01_FULL_41_9]